MKRPNLLLPILLAAGVLALSACDSHDHSHANGDHQHGIEAHRHDHDGEHKPHDDHGGGADPHGHGASDVPTEAVTHFTEHAELFVEFPVLSVGNESPFAAHFTWLDNFRPVAEGRVRVILRGGDLPEEEFSIAQASIPGIFRPVAVPAHAGQREVIVILESAKQRSEHHLGHYPVYASKASIPPAAEEDDSGAISYLKEEQWQVEFATAVASMRTLRESIRAVATIRAAANGEAEITAPHDGQLIRRGGSFPAIGTQLRKGDVLAVLGTQLGRELPTLDKGVSGTALRAPIDGVIARVHASAGAYLEKGQPVFYIVDPKQLWLESRIPEHDVLRMQQPDGAWLALPGRAEPFIITTHGAQANGRLVALSQTIDARTRTTPLILEFDNPQQQLRIGMLVEANVYTGRKAESVAVPVSAIVRDSGVLVVFVELGGESFERRVVQTGMRDGEYIEIRSGVANGERVVSKGAYLVKLAASGPAEAGHGHAH